MPGNGAPPLISVIIPCYNAEAYLAEAIESAIAQDVGTLEIIVVDDGSTDGSSRVARRFGPPVRYVSKANAGISSARNRGVELSAGRYLTFLDADDLWPEGSLRLRLEYMRAHPNTECVFGALEEFVSPDLDQDKKSRLGRTHAAMPARFAGSMLIERTAFLRVGLFHEGLKVGEMLDWVARAEQAGVVMCLLDAIVLRRRIHGNNTVTREKARRNDYLRALKMSLVRRRAAAAADTSNAPCGAGNMTEG